MEITDKTKVHDLLQTYPELEEKLIALNPKYKKLKNPILRKTIARVATLRQVAAVGGMDVQELVNTLRKFVGQEPIVINEEKKEQIAPQWIMQEPQAVFDANELLDSGQNPLAVISKKLKELPQGSMIVLKSDFLPEPLIEEFKKRGHEVYAKPIDEEHYLTYIKV
ncbi:DUF1858 domain-containing protein [Nitratiruptor sp. YY09-18]|uniref:DUF1858 domain-containing protein n=1 Tax=Nitratiruptor sp. YY09-18 TaxID=2724901 RepID=UPI0019154CAB|nr:DUF1858 domain-containing protein [Nitratiruptor sp. YY09-18]BCD68888.1 hypothetical protein NitYY0918_C1807 [Nitratiruptor sp. YY09-18]